MRRTLMKETGEFALLDARQLPGACGGVLVRETVAQLAWRIWGVVEIQHE